MSASFESSRLPPHPAATSAARDESDRRLAQILDEQDHDRCTDGNKNALLQEKLDRLRSLRKEMEEDDWMFAGDAGKGGLGGGLRPGGGI